MSAELIDLCEELGILGAGARIGVSEHVASSPWARLIVGMSWRLSDRHLEGIQRLENRSVNIVDNRLDRASDMNKMSAKRKIRGKIQRYKMYYLGRNWRSCDGGPYKKRGKLMKRRVRDGQIPTPFIPKS